jgi:hypothetical protein
MFGSVPVTTSVLPASGLLLHLQPVGAQPLDQLLRALLGQRLGHGARRHRPDALGLLDLLLARGHQRVDRAELVGQRARRDPAHVLDAERVQHPVEGLLL